MLEVNIPWWLSDYDFACGFSERKGQQNNTCDPMNPLIFCGDAIFCGPIFGYRKTPSKILICSFTIAGELGFVPNFEPQPPS